MTETQNKEYNDFLKKTLGQKEVSLAIAKDNDELKSFISVLETEGFKQAKTVSNLFIFSKVYFPLNTEIQKDVYDFLAQYPTGRVEIFDTTKMESKVFSPEYTDSSVIYLVLNDDLSVLQEKGFDILSKVGLTFQS